MAIAEIDRLNCEIRLLYPTNESVKKLAEWQEEINNYPIKIIPQNTITDEQILLYSDIMKILNIYHMYLTVILN